jgi:excisionase family DNA binding protein
MLTIPQACRALAVSRSTLESWIRAGLVAVVQPRGPNGGRRIAQAEIDRLLGIGKSNALAKKYLPVHADAGIVLIVRSR